MSHGKRRRFRRRTTPGAPAGAFVTDPAAAPTGLRVLAYGPDGLFEQANPSPAEVRALRSRWPVTWVSIEGLGDEKLLREIGSLFGVHPLALEDVVHAHQRPKVDDYGDSLFVVARRLDLNEGVRSEQISLFVGPGFLLSFHESQTDLLEGIRGRIRADRGGMRRTGSDYLAYAILDHTIDHYFPVLEGLGERIDALEECLLGNPDRSAAGLAHLHKKELLAARRDIWPMRDMINGLIRDGHPLLTENTRVHLRDCYDHTIQVIDVLENLREIGSGLTELYMTSVSNRMNEVMKVLTVITTLFIPLTFIVGLYGMNFNSEASPWNMPELNAYFGYPFVIVTLAVVAVAQLLFFRRRGWI